MKNSTQVKVQYTSRYGEHYAGMTARGKDHETAVKNLYAKIYRKEKKDLLNSFTLQEIESLYKLFDCQVGSMDSKEFESDVSYDGDCWGLTEWEQVNILSSKLQKLQRLIKKTGGSVIK